MVWFLKGHVFSTLLSLIRVSRLSEDDKDLEIIILRHQLDVMVPKQTQLYYAKISILLSLIE